MNSKSINEITTLAIDTSCDETSCSIVRGTTVLSSVMPSQQKYHEKYGGVVPSLAKLAHTERIDNVVVEALKRAIPHSASNDAAASDRPSPLPGEGETQESDLRKYMSEVDLVAVTYGPGLAIALEVGVRKAIALAEKFDKPLMIINHMEGHLLSGFVERNSKVKIKHDKEHGQITHPPFRDLPSREGKAVLGFLISGGHTEMIKVNGIGDYEKIGVTLDDSCGEYYDKAGRMLGLGYPAGPTVSRFADDQRKKFKIEIKKNNKSTNVIGTNKESGTSYSLPIPMYRSGDFNFSFSGLKTAFKELTNSLVKDEITIEDQLNKETKNLSGDQINDLCVMIEASAITQLKVKLERAIKKHNPSELWLGGGVIASKRLRSEFRSLCKKNDVKLKYPYSSKLTGDNAAMIGVAANIKLGVAGGELRVAGIELGRETGNGVNKMGSLFDYLRENKDKAESLGVLFNNFDRVDRDPNAEIDEEIVLD
ncbi:MAG: hypothetical protein Q9M91_03960 [Candidatus Dojkabacteria bacterium]|nr:hypothetical protein [Candidatus Dojkabacteria bacterium]MDQ7020968.1 hypothetical protein [Candidatus Dojkabacteria bacterium]